MEINIEQFRHLPTYLDSMFVNNKPSQARILTNKNLLNLRNTMSARVNDSSYSTIYRNGILSIWSKYVAKLPYCKDFGSGHLSLRLNKASAVLLCLVELIDEICNESRTDIQYKPITKSHYWTSEEPKKRMIESAKAVQKLKADAAKFKGSKNFKDEEFREAVAYEHKIHTAQIIAKYGRASVFYNIITTSFSKNGQHHYQQFIAALSADLKDQFKSRGLPTTKLTNKIDKFRRVSRRK